MGQGADDLRTVIGDGLGTGMVVTMLLKGEPEDGVRIIYSLAFMTTHLHSFSCSPTKRPVPLIIYCVSVRFASLIT